MSSASWAMCGSSIIHHRTVFTCFVCVSVQVRSLFQASDSPDWTEARNGPWHGAGRWPHHYGLWSQWEKTPQPSSLLHTHTIKKEKPKMRRVSVHGDSLNRPPKQIKPDFTELHVHEFNKNKLSTKNISWAFGPKTPPETPERMGRMGKTEIEIWL